MKHLSSSIILLLGIFSCFTVYSQGFGLTSYTTDTSFLGAFDNFPENDEARRLQVDGIFAPLFELIKAGRRIIYQNSYGTEVIYEVKETKDYLYIIFANRDRHGSYDLPSKGDYIIKRSRKNGKFLQLKVFIRDDTGSFVRIYPDGDRSIMDLYIYGFSLYKGVIVPARFKDILTMKFQRVALMTEGIIDWKLLLYKGSPEDEDIRIMADKIREALPRLKDADDGALDEKGNFVYIETEKPQIESSSKEKEIGGFNCSGFAKWIADGLYFELTGKLLDIKNLKRKELEYRGNRWSKRYEDERDPYFGLDWSRNLAVKLEEVRLGKKIDDPEAMDVRDDRYIPYIEDVGYPVKDLKFLLFYLTRKNPGFFYIGSVNREFGRDPVLRQHFHVVVIFPYFDRSGNFRVTVMERNVETSIESLFKRYGENYIHLVKVKADKKFIPLLFE